MEDKVKKNLRIKGERSAFFIFIALVLSSCSSLWLHRGQTVDSALNEGVQNTEGKTTLSTVPKEQYDELARKYQDLLLQSKNLKTENTEQTNKEEMEKTTLDPSELVARIDNAIPDMPGDEAPPPVEHSPAPTATNVVTENNTDEIDEQITKLREVQALIKLNKFENALTILKGLETSKEKQIVVRAKMMLGDLLFNQGEFDLASQVYEEIINKYAFSGFIIKALGKLVVCSEKLKQPEKQAKYYSLLHDFFEAS